MSAPFKQLHGYPGIPWRKELAKTSGRCSLSGTKIAVGDKVYTTDHPRLTHWMVLVDEYVAYEAGLSERGEL